MNLLEQFINYLLNQRNRPSPLTVKNYKADINQFIAWCEKEFSFFNPKTITYQVVQNYKKARQLSENSMERHNSSLRKFFRFLQEKGIAMNSPFPLAYKERLQPDPWKLKNFKSFLYDLKKSNLTIKNYINDIKSFFVWLEEASLSKYAWNLNDKNLLEKIDFSVIEEYKQRLILAHFSPATVNRKLSSLRAYISWARNQGFIKNLNSIHITQRFTPASLPSIKQDQKNSKEIVSFFDYLFILPLAQVIQKFEHILWKISGRKIFKKMEIFKEPLVQPDDISNISKEFYAPLSISTKYLPSYKRFLHHLRHTRPNWYKIYHSYPLTHYFHFALLTIISCIIGFGIYNEYFANQILEKEVLGVTTSAPPRILSFQGRLTDSSESPITKDTSILFSIYSDENASSGASLWQETNIVKPDSEGIFSVLLGKKTLIPDTTFSQNSKLYLGITVGNSPELKPRQQIATVPFASNAETLQGLVPITNSTQTNNVLLALDSSGDLSIAGTKTHKFQTIGGQFILSGKILTLTSTQGSNGNIQIAPDGTGIIDFTRPIQNSSNNNNLSSAMGAVEFDDVVAILATTSAQSAFYINQNSTGSLISASTNNLAKFTVGNDGSGTFAGDITFNGGDLSSTASTVNLFNTSVTTLNIGSATSSAYVKGNLTVDKEFNLPSFTSNGGILYTNGSGKIYQASAGSSNTCLIGGSTPTFGPCPGSGYLSSASGTLFGGNTTMDFLIGGDSTASAKFAFININQGTPTASISGDLTLNSAGFIRTTKMQPLTIGGDTTGGIGLAAGSNTPSLFVANGGSIGMGTTAPAAKLDVVGGQTQIEISTQYTERLCHSGVDGNSTQSVLIGDCDSGGADIAEHYGSKDPTIEAGDIVRAAPGAITVGKDSKAYVDKSSESYQGEVIGIVSTNPYDSFGKNFDQGEFSFPVALAGRVPVKISLLNGSIKAGDLLTSSNIPGVAMKATRAGLIIGKALEDIDSIDETETIGYFDPDNNEYRRKSDLPNIPLKSTIVPIGKIHAFANISWYDPNAYLADNGQLTIRGQESDYSIVDETNRKLSNTGGFFRLLAANIEAGAIKASRIVAQTLIVTSDTIIVNGQNLKDYIDDLIESRIMNNESSITSPLVSTNNLAADIISPLSNESNISISLQDSKFIIHDSRVASSSAIASIDNQGNASFSGQLTADSASFNNLTMKEFNNEGDATVSGTLHADKIIANSIEGLEAKVSSITANTILNAKYDMQLNFADLASASAQLAYVPDLTADRARINQGLMVFGPTSTSDLSVAGSLSIGGNMFVTENSIESLGTDLAIQSLRQGNISMMSGLIHIDTDGNVKIQGDLSVLGKLAVNIISPLPTSDLKVINASSSSVLAINQTGDLIASGSGTFTKLNLSMISPALAISSSELIASSSAGNSQITPYHDEITIRNPLVTVKSVIYITPVGTPSAQSPFLMRQSPENESSPEIDGSFTVGVESPTNRPIDFNWLIIN